MLLSRFPRRWSVCFAICLATVLAVGLLLFWFHLPSLAQIPDPSAGGDIQAVFTRQDGLVANSVTALLRDDRSLWVGTTEGLSRYPLRGREAGLEWQTFTGADGLAADAVSALWNDDEGGVWVAHPDGQISVFDGRIWATYPSPTQTLEQAYDQIVSANADGPAWAIEQGGRVWTLDEDTVGYFVGAVWRPYGEDAGLPRGQLIDVWADENAWVVSDNGQVGYFDGATWTTFRNAFDAVQRLYEDITAVGPTTGPLWVVDKEGAVWVRQAFNQRNPRPDVRRYAEESWTNFSSRDGMVEGFVQELRLDSYGRVWARHIADENGQGGGLSLFDGETWRAIIPAFTGNVVDFAPEGTDGVWVASAYQPAGSGVPVGGVTYVALNAWQRFPLATLEGSAVSDTWLDEEDTLWVGLSADVRRGLPGGLWRYRPSQGVEPVAWTQVKGLAGGDVRDLWGDGQGALWVATDQGVNRLTLNNRRVVSYTLSPPPNQISGDALGNVWALASGEEGEVWQWDSRVWAGHSVAGGLSGSVYADMLVLPAGDVYLAGNNGVDIWDGVQWITFAALPGRHVRRVWQDDAGDLWLSSEITPGRPFNLSLKQGRLWETVLNEMDSQRMGPAPLAHLRNDREYAWLGAPLGLFLYDVAQGGRWRGLGPVEGLPVGPIPAIYEDASGAVWVANGEQIYRTENRADWDWRQFEPHVGLVNRIAPGPEESVLFAGDAGVALYNPTVPELRLDGVTNLITGEEADGDAPVVLTIGRNAIRIDLTAVAPTFSSRQISYRYRLEGFDDDWRVLPAAVFEGKQAAITYAGLPSGVYTFTAAARTDVLDYGPGVSFELYVLSKPPALFLDQVTVDGRPVKEPGNIQTYVSQTVQIRLVSGDDQLGPLTYRYQIEGLDGGWTETAQSDISFTLSAVDTYTFVAMALDDEGQTSPLASSQIIVREWEPAERSNSFSVVALAAGLGLLALVFIAAAIRLIVKRRKRESW